MYLQIYDITREEISRESKLFIIGSGRGVGSNKASFRVRSILK